MDAVAARPTALVAAGGGYGKTLLAGELAERLELATVSVALGPRDGEPAALVARLVAALERTRLADAAAAVRELANRPGEALLGLAPALAREREPVLVLVDDAHHLTGESAATLAELARELPAGHRLLVLARRLPAVLELLREAGATLLGAAELAFTRDEAAELCGRGFGLELADADLAALVRATAGWAAPLVLAAERLARSDDVHAELQAIVDQRAPLRYLVRRQLADLDEPSRAALVQLAHLPLVSPALAAAVAGDERLFDRAAAAGLPFGARADGWYELPGPVQELLRRAAPLEPDAAARAARAYAEAGELAEALHVLLAAGEAGQAAGLLAGLSPEEADELGYLELQTLADALPEPELEQHPLALLHLARSCEPAAQTRARARALEQAAAIAARAGDAALARAVEAEQARDLVRDGRADEAEAKAAGLLRETGAGELATRARLLDVLGRCAAWRRDDASLERAERLLREAAALCRQLGQRSWESQVALPLGHGVHYARGRHEQALETLDRVLEQLPGRSRHRGVILAFYGDMLVDCGRFAEAEAIVEEARRLGALLGDRRVLAYAAWTAARLASQTFDAARTLEEVRAADAERGDWFDHSTGVDFLADAADLLDRVGETAAALGYLERARARRDEAPLAVALAEAAVLARSGDPEEAERALARVEELPRLEPRERWRLPLLRASAALRRGDPAAGRLAAEAFDAAAALGKPFLPLVREPALAERLLALAAASGSAAAAALAGARSPLTARVLGGFEVREGGRPVPLPPGKPGQLVKLLCVSGGRLPLDAAIEELWPEVDPATGRRRLRNVLARVRAVAELVERRGELLALADVEVDADLFETDARRVLDAGERAHLARALARYRGPLLPDDRYESWASAPRERLERLFLRLADVAAEAAAARGDVDEAVRLLERALELEPFDEARYLRAARLLLEQGRRGPALALLGRATRALGELGIPISPQHEELAAAIRR